MMTIQERLPGENETKIVCRTRVRRECENCGEPAIYRNTYLNDGDRGARRNPASSAYGRDDCTWCSDHDQFLCGDCHQNHPHVGVPDGYNWDSTFECSERFAHMFLEWREETIDYDRLLQDRAGLSAALDSLAKTAAMLHANSVQCLRDHHGVSVDEAFPPWLADALRDIEAARNLVQRMESNP